MVGGVVSGGAVVVVTATVVVAATVVSGATSTVEVVVPGSVSGTPRYVVGVTVSGG